ncbi:MAG: hypothetical protein NT075_10675 [Chloroflexi bacterium]|nr:hypothetical protein [Chloroflexota bacterium]
MIARVRVNPSIEEVDREQIIVPIAIPEIDDVRKFAAILHQNGQPYTDTVWGWPVKYSPEKATPPPDSKMTFTPADFFIGVWSVWWVSLMWENGRDAEPNLSIGDDELLKD